MTGATTSCVSEPSILKQTISFCAYVMRSALLPHAYCCSLVRFGCAFVWLMCCARGEGTIPLAENEGAKKQDRLCKKYAKAGSMARIKRRLRSSAKMSPGMTGGARTTRKEAEAFTAVARGIRLC